MTFSWSWYNRQFYINNAIRTQISSYSISLRIASCHYYCIVWLNGVQLGTHESGHLPFEFDITSAINTNDQSSLNLVVAVNNTLTPQTIPPATLFYGNNDTLYIIIAFLKIFMFIRVIFIRYPPNYVQQTLQMAFYNFAGNHYCSKRI